MSKLVDLTGKKIGRWTVVSRASDRFHGNGKNKRRHTVWNCECECGSVNEVLSSCLRKGNSTSCGCYAVELTKARLTKEGTAFRDVICSYKASARSRNLSFTLTETECNTLFGQECFYCGCIDSLRREQPSGEVFMYNGIDRVDSKLGYELNNVVTACFQCNRMKQSFTKDSFIDKCKDIARKHAQTG